MKNNMILLLLAGTLCSGNLIKGEGAVMGPVGGTDSLMRSWHMIDPKLDDSMTRSLEDSWIAINPKTSKIQDRVVQDVSVTPKGEWLKGYNDIDSQGAFAWNTLTHQGVQCSFNYCPRTVVAGAQPVAVILVHGTWATADNDEFSSTVLTSLQGSMANIAESWRAPVKLLSFGWSGANTDEARMAAGQKLALLIRQALNGYKIVVLDHSHGGNAVKHATQYLDKPIDLVIHTGSPVIQGAGAGFYAVEEGKINLELNFISHEDTVHILGGNQLIDVAKDSVSDLFNKARNAFQWTGFVNPPTSKPINYAWGWNHMFSGVRKIAGINVRTLYKGYGPDHGLIKHVVVRALPIILQMLDTHYGKLIKFAKEQKASIDFDLNVDFEVPMQEYQVILAIRKEHSNELLKQYGERFKEEMLFSDYQKKAFKLIYKRDIESNGGFIKHKFNNVYNLYVMAKEAVRAAL
jgi:hypothetical protein